MPVSASVFATGTRPTLSISKSIMDDNESGAVIVRRRVLTQHLSWNTKCKNVNILIFKKIF